MPIWRRLQFDHVNGSVGASFDGDVLAGAAAASLYELLAGVGLPAGAGQAAAPDRVMLKILRRDSHLVVDVYRCLANGASEQPDGCLRGQDAWNFYRPLYPPGHDPVLPVQIEVITAASPAKAQ